MHALSCLRRLLAACFVGLMVVLLHAIHPQRAFEAPVPTETIAIIHEYIATIDELIVDGDALALEWHLTTLGRDLGPWPHPANGAFESIAALAFRATYPRPQIGLATIERSDQWYAAEIHIAGGERAWPAWLAPPASSLLADSDVLLNVDERGVIEQVGPVPLADPLVYSAPNPSASFLLADPTKLVAARMTLLPSEHGVRYLAVGSPGIVAPEDESLLVEGVGRLLVLTVGSQRWRQPSPDEETVVAPGDLLYLADGFAILRMTGTEPAQFSFVAAIDVADRAGDEPEGGRTAPTDVARLIEATGSTPAPAWFGSIEAVSRSTTTIPAGLASLAAAWIVLPPGASVALSPDISNVIAIQHSEPDAAAVMQANPMRLDNPTPDPIVMLIVRTAGA